MASLAAEEFRGVGSRSNFGSSFYSHFLVFHSLLTAAGQNFVNGMTRARDTNNEPLC